MFFNTRVAPVSCVRAADGIPLRFATPGWFPHCKCDCKCCWGVLVRDDLAPTAKLAQCTRLRNQEACDFIGTWIMVSKTARCGR